MIPVTLPLILIVYQFISIVNILSQCINQPDRSMTGNPVFPPYWQIVWNRIAWRLFYSLKSTPKDKRDPDPGTVLTWYTYTT